MREMINKNDIIYIAELCFRSYIIRVIDVSEEAACKKIYEVWKRAINDGNYIDDIGIKNWQDLRDFGISVYGTKIGEVEWL